MTTPQADVPRRRLGPIARYEAARTLIAAADKLGEQPPQWAVNLVADQQAARKTA